MPPHQYLSMDVSSVVNHNVYEKSFFSLSHDIMCMDKEHEVNHFSTLSQSNQIKNSLQQLLSEFQDVFPKNLPVGLSSAHDV